MTYDWGGIIFLLILCAIGGAGLAFFVWDWLSGRKIPSGMDGRGG